MKQYRGQLFIIIFLILSFAFIYYSASTKILFFERSEIETLARDFQIELKNLEEAGKEIVVQLETIAKNEIISEILANYELGNSLEEGLASLEYAAKNIPFCLSLSLIGLDNQVVLDTEIHEKSGSLLSELESGLVRSLLRFPGKFMVSNSGDCEVAVRCLSEAGLDIGLLRARFSNLFLTSQFDSKIFSIISFNDSLLLSFSQIEASPKFIAQIEALARSAQPAKFEDFTLFSFRSEFTPQLLHALYGKDFDTMPKLAKQLLLIVGLLILALFLILFLRVLNNWESKRLDSINFIANKQDEQAQDLKASAEEIILATSNLESTDLASQQPKADFESPTLASVMAQLDANPALKTQGERKLDSDLQSAIDQVANKKFSKQPDSAPEDLVSAWWNKIILFVQEKLKVSDLLLLDLEKDRFRLAKQQGFENLNVETCEITKLDKLYTLFVAKRKILFVHEDALRNPRLKSLLSGIHEDLIDQVFIFPLVIDDLIQGILILGRKSSQDSVSNKEVLQEIQYLSIL